MASRIEQIIEEIEEYIDGCKFQALSSTKIVVNKEELEEMLRELRMKTPDEIKRYRRSSATRMPSLQMHSRRQIRSSRMHRRRRKRLSARVRLCRRRWSSPTD